MLIYFLFPYLAIFLKKIKMFAYFLYIIFSVYDMAYICFLLKPLDFVEGAFMDKALFI